MRIVWQSTLLVVLGFAAAGCATSRQLEPYPQSHRAYDLTIAWKTSQQDAALTIAGTVPAKLRFFYRYRYGEEKREGILDFHSFEVELP